MKCKDGSDCGLGGFCHDCPTLIDYHKKCHDCGQFIPKKRWVSFDHSWKKHALCYNCLHDYD